MPDTGPFQPFPLPMFASGNGMYRYENEGINASCPADSGSRHDVNIFIKKYYGKF